MERGQLKDSCGPESVIYGSLSYLGQGQSVAHIALVVQLPAELVNSDKKNRLTDRRATA